MADGVQMAFQAVWRLLTAGDPWQIDVGSDLQCIASVDRLADGTLEEHVSVSRRDGRLPRWDDLVLVRALAWPDDVEVFQVLPAGDEEWVSVRGVEVLHLRRDRPRGA
jgi:hypothetical protein